MKRVKPTGKDIRGKTVMVMTDLAKSFDKAICPRCGVLNESPYSCVAMCCANCGYDIMIPYADEELDSKKFGKFKKETLC